MKKLSKVLAVLIVLVMALSLVPVLEAPASAASTPILVLSSTTAVNPILDHVLSATDFGSGGDHTVTFEWRAVNIKDNDPNDPNSGHAFVGITGSPSGSLTGDNTVKGLPAGIKGTTDWASVTFTFGNVGFYNVSGSNIPGNILRFGMWHAKGELQIRNLKIKTGNTVKYDLNTDSVVAQAVANTEAMGMTECALDELYMIDFENCPWTAGQFSTGNYTSSIKLEAGSAPATSSSSSVTRPTASTTTASTTKQTTASTTASTTKQTTAPTTANNTTASTTTAKPTTRPTTRPTTVATQPGAQDPCANGHSFANGYCIYCAASDPNYDPCANGHDFVNGYCAICLEPDPTATTAPTAASTTQAPTTQAPVADNTNNGGLAIDPVWLIVFVMVFAVGICVVVLYATGVFNKKK